MKFYLLETPQVLFRLGDIQLGLVCAHHIAAVAKVPLHDKLVRQSIPANLIHRLVNLNNLVQNLVEAAIANIVAHPHLVGTLVHQGIVLVVVHLHPLYLLVKGLGIFEIEATMMAKPELQADAQLRRDSG